MSRRARLIAGLALLLVVLAPAPAYPWTSADEERWSDCVQQGFACTNPDLEREWQEQRRQEQRRNDYYQDEIRRPSNPGVTCYTRRDTFGNLETTCY